MAIDNPYDAPTQVSPALPGGGVLFTSIGAVFAAGLIGGTLGALVGGGLGAVVPGYYRSIFASGSEPGFDPLAVGIGLGLTQGVVFGTFLGLALVALFYWYRSRVARRA